MERQYYFDEDFAGAEYRAVIDLVGRKAHFVGLVFSVGIGRSVNGWADSVAEYDIIH